MSFTTALALLVGVLVAAPLVAHLLRRRKTERVLFPPAALVLAAQPVARQRARLEDRGLFAIRALAVLALAVLGATPFVSCSRLSLGRNGGGSVAVLLVLDDSMSMQARLGSSTRFERAKEGAREVLGSLREGDVVGLIGAGTPARVLMAATSDLAAVRATLDALTPADRGTDLDTSLTLAAGIARALPHADRRIVLLSDLADGSGSDQPPGLHLDVPLWIPLDELRAQAPDCAVLRATRKGPRLSVDVICGADQDAQGRSVEIRLGDKILASANLEPRRSQQLALSIEDATPAGLVARLTGQDAIPGDDQAPVTAASVAMQIAVVSDLSASALVTGGPSPAEQALAALDETVAVRPLPVVPDDAETLQPYAVLVLDDPPGLTPEARAGVRSWMERGGVGLLWLGPRAGGAILGAAFEPFFPGPARWVNNAPSGAAPDSIQGLGEVGEGLLALAPRGRALLEERAFTEAQVQGRWSDGAPLLFQRAVGRGSATVVTLPASAESSDLPLRPVFLELLARALEAGRAQQLGRRSVAGAPWSFPGAIPDEIVGPGGPLPLREGGNGRVATPGRAGQYALRFGAQQELRVVEIDEREVDTRPRPATPPAQERALGTQRATIDASPYVAFVLLLVIAAEAGLRLRARPKDEVPGAA
ncbi:MAG: BatA and WFA domain-containing protein [Polyangiaceae bacterium]|jgi:hypothetical protein|nr:BatA and WFA domain-containing protein [Polyangiaceae bacterium]